MLSDLWASGLLRLLRATGWTSEYVRMGLIRSVRFPNAGWDSNRATWRLQCLLLPGKTGLVMWYWQLPETSAAEDGVKSRKCPVVIKQREKVQVWHFYGSQTRTLHQCCIRELLFWRSNGPLNGRIRKKEKLKLTCWLRSFKVVIK